MDLYALLLTRAVLWLINSLQQVSFPSPNIALGAVLSNHRAQGHGQAGNDVGHYHLDGFWIKAPYVRMMT